MRSGALGLAVRASLAPVGQGTEIQITVEGKGVGIAGYEIDQIFEPSIIAGPGGGHTNRWESIVTLTAIATLNKR